MAPSTLLAQVMAQRGISQGELIRRTRLARQTVTDVYYGRRDGSVETWVRIAKAIPCKVSEINEKAADDLSGLAV